ncbi:SMP-30/gluconolactonase/LRE family protein [Streptomyces sp. NPDC046821]|uniref:SMP-30/gluconolactonase/LRE family protein n=1 Tax=Streptomyces sp. NPDC046821 TaxID=3154702 RepID=UPI0033C2B624
MTYVPQKIAGGFTFPESPRWHAGRQAFYFVDIDAGNLFELKDGIVRCLHTFPDFISGLSFDDEDGFFVASCKTNRVVHLTGALTGENQVRVVSDLNQISCFGLNDHARAANGDIFQGVLNYNAIASFSDPAVPQVPGSVQRIRPDGSLEAAPGEVLFPNGVVIAEGGKRLLVADTYGNKISSWPIHEDGSLGEISVWADLGEHVPDGICLDADGALWIAADRTVLRVREGGEVLDEIGFDLHSTSVMLGGPDGRTLLITAAAGIDRRVVHASLTGTLFQVTVDVPGGALPSIYS